MAITRQDVWRVAGEIDAAGEKPTAVEVRKRLGTGSYTTITAALKEWVRPDEEADELEPVPEEFEEKIAQAGADLFALAMRIAEDRFREEREQWARERAELEQEKQDALDLADQLGVMLDKSKAEIEGLKQSVEREMREADKGHTLAEERKEEMELARNEARNAKALADRLQGQVEALEAVIETLKPSEKRPGSNAKRNAAPGTTESRT
jgi:chromosome segregation ATPase